MIDKQLLENMLKAKLKNKHSWDISLCRYYYLGAKAFNVPHKHSLILLFSLFHI